MNKLHILILSILLSLGCQTHRKDEARSATEEQPFAEKSEERNDIETISSGFKSYVGSIPKLELPFTTDCYSDYPDYPNVDTELKTKFTESEWESPYRRIPTEKNFEIVLYLASADIILPIIKTYDNSGRVISSEQMFFGYCGGEPGYYHTEHIIIKPNLVITHIDSTWTHEVDSLDNEIEGTEKLEAKSFDYRILENGEIVKRD